VLKINKAVEARRPEVKVPRYAAIQRETVRRLALAVAAQAASALEDAGRDTADAACPGRATGADRTRAGNKRMAADGLNRAAGDAVADKGMK